MLSMSSWGKERGRQEAPLEVDPSVIAADTGGGDAELQMENNPVPFIHCLHCDG